MIKEAEEILTQTQKAIRRALGEVLLAPAEASSLDEIDRIRKAYRRRGMLGLDERYSLVDPANLYLFQRRERAFLSLLRQQSLSLTHIRVLDIGCGTGEVLNDFVRYGADPLLLAGIDLLPERIERAHRRNPRISFSIASAEKLPYPDGAFDLCLQFTLLSSVLDGEVRRCIAAEALRVLRPNGVVILYDFIWDPTNRDVRGIRLGEVRRLYPACELSAHRVTLAPPLSRRLAPVSWTLCRVFEALPFLCSHHLVAIRKGP